MDVAFVSRMVGITRGGGEMWDLKMAEGLEERGANVTFYAAKPLLARFPEPVDGFEVVPVPTPHLKEAALAAPKGVGGALAHLDSRLFCRRTADLLQNRDHNIVQICSQPNFAQHVNCIDAPVSIVMHGTPYSLWYDVVKPWGSTYDLLEEFDQVVAVEGASQSIEEHSSCSVEIINPGVDTDQFSPNGPTIETDGPTILFVGRFVPAKNLTLLVEAFADVVEHFPSAELMLIGDGPLRNRIEKRIRELGIQNRVRMPGYVDNADLPQYYRSADVFVLSSRRENHPITLLEAMSCGTPVVTPDIGAISDIVDNETNGLLYLPDSLDDLRESLKQLLSDSSFRSQLGTAGRKKMQKEYDWRRQSKRLYKLLGTFS
jgi:glycosyltransferase involved in cell wall biosynthesis